MHRIRNALARYLGHVRSSPTQLATFLMAAWFTSNGPVALLIYPNFSMHPTQSRTIELLGFIPVTVNGWHALFHLITGVVGLFCLRTSRTAARYAGATAVVYAAAGVLGLLGGTSVCGMMAVDTFGNWVHVVEALILAGISAATVASNRVRHNSIRPATYATQEK